MDVKTTCLGVLALGDATGYEIRKAFEDGPFAHFADGGFGSIYPALNRLEADGLVTSIRMDQEKRPAKKVYAITDSGHRALMSSLARPPGEDKFKSNFLFILYFADRQSPEWLEQVIDQRIAEYRAVIHKMEHEAHLCNQLTEKGLCGPYFVHGMGLNHYRGALNYLEREKDGLIAACRAKQSSEEQTSPALGQVAE